MERDIVERLLDEYGDYTPREAADEIERWRAENARLAADLDALRKMDRALLDQTYAERDRLKAVVEQRPDPADYLTNPMYSHNKDETAEDVLRMVAYALGVKEGENIVEKAAEAAFRKEQNDG